MKKTRVLIVEDEFLMALDIQESLQKMGYDVPVIISKGEDAIAAAAELRPDLVLMDIVIPGKINGIQAAEQIEKLFDIPVIYLTAYSDKEILDQATQTMPYGYLLKPFDGRQVKVSIEVALYKHRIENQLKESERTKNALLNATTDSLFLIDSDGTILALNDAMARRLNRTFEEVVGMRTDSPIIRDTIGVKEECVDEVIRSANPVRIEEEVQGTWFDTHLYPVRDQEGRVTKVAIFCHDITSHKEALENQLRLAKLESLGVIAGGIAHQFNNVLTGVLGNISLALLETEKEGDAACRLSKAVEEIYRARQLTARLLTFSRGGEPVRRVTDILPVVEDTVKNAIPAGTYRITYEIESNLPMVAVDVTQFTEALLQTLENAVHSMQKGGNIRISAKKEFVPETTAVLRRGEYLCIGISDEGTGIPPSHLNKIFDIYFTTREGSWGLGLPIALSIVRRHGGDMRIVSTYGKGSDVYIYLPVAEPVKAAERIGKERINVLIMDDEPGILDVSSTYLKMKGYSVTTVKDGGEAVRAYLHGLENNQPFDVVILDLIVPAGMGGKETVTELKKIDPDIVAIASSGYSDDPVLADYPEYGFSGILQKPYRLSELDETIRSLFADLEGD
jgi:PAS domain S-box-containing protein